MKLSLEKVATIVGSMIPVKYNVNTILGYTKIIQTNHYDIFERSKFARAIMAVHGFMGVVKYNSKTLLLYPDIRCRFLYYKISLSTKNFPGLLSDSRVLSCDFIPYMRCVGPDKYIKSVRLCIITDKAQIYHNYPARHFHYDGISKSGDFAKFEESVIWDLPGRKYPSKEASNDMETYYPYLPEICYEYHPVLNSSPQYKNVYGNNGFPKYKTVSRNGENVKLNRFYLYSREAQANPFHFIGGGEKDCKMSLIGTYRSNVDVGVRTCIFASDDGGRQWYCKYEFADLGEYDFQQGHSGKWGRNFGNPIRLSDMDVEERECSIQIYKRTLILPDIFNQWKSKFNWTKVAETISYRQKGVLQFTTKSPHGLNTGNIIALSSNLPVDDNLLWLLNPTISSTSAGNAMLFKVEVLDFYNFSIYELVSSTENNVPCRHVHHINNLKDGWVIGTGEIYPNSWLLYVHIKERDTFSKISAADDFTIVRLNYSSNSVQRTMGMILYDDKDSSVLIASDHDTLSRPPLSISTQRLEISRNSTGVYKGCISDINDFDLFECVFESSEPCFYFQKISNMIIYCGQRGHLGIKINDMWLEERLSTRIMHYYGNSGTRYFFDNYILQKK